MRRNAGNFPRRFWQICLKCAAILNNEGSREASRLLNTIHKSYNIKHRKSHNLILHCSIVKKNTLPTKNCAFIIPPHSCQIYPPEIWSRRFIFQTITFLYLCWISGPFDFFWAGKVVFRRCSLKTWLKSRLLRPQCWRILRKKRRESWCELKGVIVDRWTELLGFDQHSHGSYAISSMF